MNSVHAGVENLGDRMGAVLCRWSTMLVGSTSRRGWSVEQAGHLNMELLLATIFQSSSSARCAVRTMLRSESETHAQCCVEDFHPHLPMGLMQDQPWRFYNEDINGPTA